MFEKSLTDLIKGIRANPQAEAEFIATCITECRAELSSIDPPVKQMAVLKLTYLQMLGHDVSWAAFHFVDTMSAPRFRASAAASPAPSAAPHSRPASPPKRCTMFTQSARRVFQSLNTGNKRCMCATLARSAISSWVVQ